MPWEVPSHKGAGRGFVDKELFEVDLKVVLFKLPVIKEQEVYFLLISIYA